MFLGSTPLLSALNIDMLFNKNLSFDVSESCLFVKNHKYTRFEKSLYKRSFLFT